MNEEDKIVNQQSKNKSLDYNKNIRSKTIRNNRKSIVLRTHPYEKISSTNSKRIHQNDNQIENKSKSWSSWLRSWLPKWSLSSNEINNNQLIDSNESGEQVETCKNNVTNSTSLSVINPSNNMNQANNKNKSNDEYVINHIKTSPFKNNIENSDLDYNDESCEENENNSYNCNNKTDNFKLNAHKIPYFAYPTERKPSLRPRLKWRMLLTNRQPLSPHLHNKKIVGLSSKANISLKNQRPAPRALKRLYESIKEKHRTKKDKLKKDKKRMDLQNSKEMLQTKQPNVKETGKMDDRKDSVNQSKPINIPQLTPNNGMSIPLQRRPKTAVFSAPSDESDAESSNDEMNKLISDNVEKNIETNGTGQTKINENATPTLFHETEIPQKPKLSFPLSNVHNSFVSSDTTVSAGMVHEKESDILPTGTKRQINVTIENSEKVNFSEKKFHFTPLEKPKDSVIMRKKVKFDVQFVFSPLDSNADKKNTNDKNSIITGSKDKLLKSIPPPTDSSNIPINNNVLVKQVTFPPTPLRDTIINNTNDSSAITSTITKASNNQTHDAVNNITNNQSVKNTFSSEYFTSKNTSNSIVATEKFAKVDANNDKIINHNSKTTEIKHAFTSNFNNSNSTSAFPTFSFNSGFLNKKTEPANTNKVTTPSLDVSKDKETKSENDKIFSNNPGKDKPLDNNTQATTLIEKNPVFGTFTFNNKKHTQDNDNKGSSLSNNLNADKKDSSSLFPVFGNKSVVTSNTTVNSTAPIFGVQHPSKNNNINEPSTDVKKSVPPIFGTLTKSSTPVSFGNNFTAATMNTQTFNNTFNTTGNFNNTPSSQTPFGSSGFVNPTTTTSTFNFNQSTNNNPNNNLSNAGGFNIGAPFISTGKKATRRKKFNGGFK